VKRSIAIASVAGVALLASLALADKFDPRKPADFTVGLPKGTSPTPRVDVKRRAQSPTALPRSMRPEWSPHSLGSVNVEQPPIAGEKGEVAVVNARGELFWIDDKGGELARVVLGTGPSGPPTFLADGTVVVVSNAGEAVGATKNGVRFRTRLGGDRGGTAPLPLEDGGVVVSTATELDALDSSGSVRARATLSEPVTGALLAAQGRVIATAASGVVYAWTPGKEPVRVGSFGDAIEKSATAIDDHTLVAVVRGSRIMALDLDRGVAVPRTAPTIGIYLGPLAVRGNVVYGMLQTPIQTFVIGVDNAGQEVLRAAVTPPIPIISADGGITFVKQETPGVLVDSTGTVAFATGDGTVGIVDPAGVVTPAPNPPCLRTRLSSRGAAVQGLVPVGPGSFVVACENGSLARYGGGG
jgi:outer membrane protein assembly factor BamB